MEPFPDLAALSDDDLKQLIDELTKEEQEVSYRRRILHGKIDLLRAELQARLRETGGKSVLEQVDLAVQDPPPVRDLQLLLGQVVDQLLEVVVRERAEIGKCFHWETFRRRSKRS